ncbi:MAG: phosphoribosyltransferase [Gemmatimonadota bacterium]|nr:phosphoribosyltransferase [Gemmatimonadota bacterium]
MSIPFMNRGDAGQQLSQRMGQFAGRADVIVLALPRGGVPVAAEIARALAIPLDVFLVRKLGLPGQEELAMGAVASGGVRALNTDITRALGVTDAMIDQVTAREVEELARRERVYRGGRLYPSLRGKTVLLVDDGVATGATMLVAVRAIRTLGPFAIIAAAPVMSKSAYTALLREADACITVATPEPFHGVGEWYRDFDQTSDAEVLEWLGRYGPPAEHPDHAHNA